MHLCHYVQRHADVRRNGHLIGLTDVYLKVHFMQWITLVEVHVKRSVISIDRLGLVTLSVW